MGPGQAGEVEKDHLRILDLGRSDGDVRGRGDGMRRSHLEGLHLGARMRGRRLECQRRGSDTPDGDEKLVLHRVEPELCCHLGRVGVGPVAVADEEGNVGDSAADFGAGRDRGDGEGGRAGDGLADIVIAQHGIWIGQDGLGDGFRGDELAQVLWQSCRVRIRCVLAGERNCAAGAADDEWSNVYCGDLWRA